MTGERSPIPLALMVLTMATASPALAAEDPWALCGPRLTPMPIGDPAHRDDPDTPTRASADRLRYETGRYTLTGNAALEQADRRVDADRLEYRQRPPRFTATGNVRYQESGLLFTAERAALNLDDDTGELSAVSYRVEAGHLQGDAARIERLDGKRSRYEDVRLSTCNPGEELWWLQAETVTIDREARQGTATHAWVSVADVPALVLPWLRFPVGSDRLTGLLAPEFGHDDDGGLRLGVPWYWNIAPNRDATITPTLYSRRGLMLGGEFRYLERNVGGSVRASYLPDDDDQGDDRWSVRQQHRFGVGAHFSGELVQRRVSDDDYLDDFDTGFGDDAFDRSERHLESYARAGWATDDWQLSADAQSWQTVDPLVADAALPYARQPRLRFNYRPLITEWPVDVSLRAEAVDFDHPEPDLRVTGSRLDVMPRLALPIRELGYHFEPAVAWRYTAYDLDDPDGGSRSPDRGLPVYSIDAGVSLERELSAFGGGLTQTLEPRLYYLYVPERDQDTLPLFDTDAPELTYSALFRDNRFDGADRVGDANQLTLGVTSRVLDTATGRNHLRFSAGQIHYFDDRDVTLGDTPETAGSSDYFTELRVNLPEGLSGTVNYRWDGSRFNDHDLYSRLRWRAGPQTLVNIGYRDRRGEGRIPLERAEASFAYRLGPQWSLLGGWREDLDAGLTSERMLGLEYENCCYAVRAVHRAVQDSAPGDQLNNQFLLQFVFKGLGGLGDTIPAVFEDTVPGYRASRLY
ncbi:MAG: LPS assembly protein LptD [Arhodomonas sp.]|nr:LPS assembly protein LptD [Arhodomonas sp.]